MNVSKINLPFLGITIHKDENKTWMDIYSKPADSKWYVSFNSNIPKTDFKTTPSCLATDTLLSSVKKL